VRDGWRLPRCSPSQKYAQWARHVDDPASRAGNVGTPELRLDGKTIDNNIAFDPIAMAAAVSR
jgi:citrate lyase beta subunit